MEDNDIWLRIKAAEIAGQVFYGLGEEQKKYTVPPRGFINFSKAIYEFIKTGKLV